MQRFSCVVALAATLIPGGPLFAAAADAIIPQPVAARHGLARSWLAQVEMDPGRERVNDMLLYEGVLYVQTDRASVSAIDAETGHQLWAQRIGLPDHPSMPLSACEDLLAVVNGSHGFVCNRFNGQVLYQAQVAGSPSNGAALSEKFVYVPTANGTIIAYRLDAMDDPAKELGKVKKDATEEEKAVAEAERRDNLRLHQEYVPPLTCQSVGKTLIQPTIAAQNHDEEFVTWPTNRGYVTLGRIDRRDPIALIVKLELRTTAPIDARVAYLPPDPKVHGDTGVIYAASNDGYVFAISDRSGTVLWKFPTAEPVIEPPAVLDGRVFVPTQLGGLFCLDAKTGKQLWWAPGIVHFVAASRQRVYAADRIGHTQILDLKTGARLDELATERLPLKLFNTRTDRLYLATESGMVQCLHEIEQTTPLLHDEDRKLKKEVVVEKKPPAPKKVAKPAGDEAPKPKPAPKKPPKEKPAKPAKKAAKAAKHLDQPAEDN